MSPRKLNIFFGEFLEDVSLVEPISKPKECHALYAAHFANPMSKMSGISSLNAIKPIKSGYGIGKTTEYWPTMQKGYRKKTEYWPQYVLTSATATYAIPPFRKALSGITQTLLVYMMNCYIPLSPTQWFETRNPYVPTSSLIILKLYMGKCIVALFNKEFLLSSNQPIQNFTFRWP